ncbi:GreA/GreB family elongation factor [Aestuariivivens sp. NBU2969]|uniref:GreA/GreB family elongation factor n=1 Tax=Aestuariivivens sp. NBU2969 TaxID=2873267 RepID=UPI001CBFC0CC|nr:GreA/GreB family elongation factor [Aestuariivivens sp. NBU2969]
MKASKIDIKIKQELYNKCRDTLLSRLNLVKATIKQLQESLYAETKSTAGDKHETGRAMVQLEREKAGQQLAEIQKTSAILSKINIEKTSRVIVLGSVVYTSKGNYFIAISVGKLRLAKDIFYAISIHSPIGQLLLGKTVNDTMVFRGENIQVNKII